MKELERSSQQLTETQKQLIVDHLEFAKKVAFKSSVAKSLNYDDVIDLATEGLIKAATKYEAGREVKFTSFAYRVIQNHLIDNFKKDYKDLLVSDFEDETSQQNLISNEMADHEQKQRLYEFLIENHHDREINLLIHRYFNNEDKATTQSELTEFYNLSQAQLSYLEKKAKERVQQQLSKF